MGGLIPVIASTHPDGDLSANAPFLVPLDHVEDAHPNITDKLP
jgi:hypothetical protein